jgi:FMN-dependent NADH-azoreductase
MSNVLLVTCNSESTTSNLRHAAGDAIHAIEGSRGGCWIRERHLYSRALPAFGEAAATALTTSPEQRSAAQWKAASFIDLLLQEARAADVLVIAAPLENGHFPKELLAWSELVAHAAQSIPRARQRPFVPSQSKVAIVIAEQLGLEDEDEERDLTTLCDGLRQRLHHIGVSDIALFEADAEGYPLRQAPLMLIVSRSALAH